MNLMTRVLRRLLRLAVSGLCLLSLLACVGAGWLWWHSLRILFRTHGTTCVVGWGGGVLVA